MVRVRLRLLARGSHHGGRLDAGDDGRPRGAPGPVGCSRRQGEEGVLVLVRQLLGLTGDDGAAPLVLDADHQQVSVEPVIRMLGQCEGGARHQPVARSRARLRLDAEAQLLQPHLAQPLALSGLHVVARVVVDLQPGYLLVLVGLGGEVQRGALEVEVPQRHLAGQQPVRALHPRHVLAHVRFLARLGAEGQGGLARQWLAGAGGVPQHQHMPVLAVLEVEEDALGLEQPAHEAQVRLAVLHAVLALGVAARECQAVIHVPRREHLLDDVGHRELLEDAAAADVAQLLEARHQTDAVLGPIVPPAQIPHLVHPAVEEALGAVRIAQAQRGLGAEQLARVDDVQRGGEELHVDFEELGERLFSSQARHHQLRGRERSCLELEAEPIVASHCSPPREVTAPYAGAGILYEHRDRRVLSA